VPEQLLGHVRPWRMGMEVRRPLVLVGQVVARLMLQRRRLVGQPVGLVRAAEDGVLRRGRWQSVGHGGLLEALRPHGHWVGMRVVSCGRAHSLRLSLLLLSAGEIPRTRRVAGTGAALKELKEL